MLTYFAIGKSRGICEAQERLYKNEIYHPVRDFPPFHDIVYFIEGAWDIVLNCDGTTEKYYLFPGDVMILPAGCAHRSDNVCLPGTKTYYIHMTSVVGDTISDSYPSGDGIIRIPLHTVIHCQNNTMICGLFEEIITLMASERYDRDEILSSLMQTLLYYLNRCDNRIVIKDFDIVDECISKMKQSSDKFFTEDEMAKSLFISPKTLRRSFMHRFGKTFYKYQLDYKIGQAYALLNESPDMKLHEIAQDLGFCDEFHLSRLFKNKYGMSPNNYKKKMSTESSGNISG